MTYEKIEAYFRKGYWTAEMVRMALSAVVNTN